MKLPHIHRLSAPFCCRLDQYRLIEISGADSEKYLQGQLTCDVAKLAVGAHTLTCHCDPKGKISALFRLYRATDTQFFAIMPTDLLPEALTQLKKYAVFSKVTFNECEQPLFATNCRDIAQQVEENSTVLAVDERFIAWNVAWQADDAASLNDYADILAGYPLLYKANQFEHIPQAVNLQMLEQAISFTKGCYIGQETVARAKYRGANKRAMFNLVGDCERDEIELAIGGAVELQLGENWKQTGTILSGVLLNGKLWLQVVLNKEIDAESRFRYDGIALSLSPLPYAIE